MGTKNIEALINHLYREPSLQELTDIIELSKINGLLTNFTSQRKSHQGASLLNEILTAVGKNIEFYSESPTAPETTDFVVLPINDSGLYLVVSIYLNREAHALSNIQEYLLFQKERPVIYLDLKGEEISLGNIDPKSKEMARLLIDYRGQRPVETDATTRFMPVGEEGLSISANYSRLGYGPYLGFRISDAGGIDISVMASENLHLSEGDPNKYKVQYSCYRLGLSLPSLELPKINPVDGWARIILSGNGYDLSFNDGFDPQKLRELKRKVYLNATEAKVQAPDILAEAAGMIWDSLSNRQLTITPLESPSS